MSSAAVRRRPTWRDTSPAPASTLLAARSSWRLPGASTPRRCASATSRATDTYLATGDFDLALDDETCVASNRRRARFRVTGGTGALAAATGRGHFDIAMNWTPCNGLSLPAQVWFDSDLDAAR